jgi:glyoxylase-like metal-dependent hydrolase (beta-lactamase superfamily II)
MIIEKLEVGAFAENCYIVGCEKTLEGVVIDPGDEIPRILSKINEIALEVKYIFLTHAHLDHVKELNALKEEITVPVFMHAADDFLLENLPAQAATFGLSISGIPKVDKYVKEGDSIDFGQQSFKVLHTPGHSPGSVSYVSPGAAFVGDVLFAGSIGRTDLPGGDYDTLINSIKTKLYSLGDETIIYPGHGPHTTLSREKQSNPFLIP